MSRRKIQVKKKTSAFALHDVSLTTALTFGSGDDAIQLQSVLDNVLPGLLPALLILFSFIYLSKKGKFINLLVAYLLIGMAGAKVLVKYPFYCQETPTSFAIAWGKEVGVLEQWLVEFEASDVVIVCPLLVQITQAGCAAIFSGE